MLREKLVTARKERNLSVADIAELLGISGSFYYKIEAGTRNPTLELASRIADIFNMTVDELFCGQSGDKKHSDTADGTSHLRPMAVQAWQRCLAYKVNPKRPVHEFLDPEAFAYKQIVYRMLVRLAAPWMEYISTVIADCSHVVVLSDPEGWILQVQGNPDALGGREHGMCRGANWSEALIGNNPIGTALAICEKVSFKGTEHFVRQYRDLAGFGLPIKGNGKVCGALGVFVEEGADVDPGPLLAEGAQSIQRMLETLQGLANRCSEERTRALGRLVFSTMSELQTPLLTIRANCEKISSSETNKSVKRIPYQFQDICRMVNQAIRALDLYAQRVAACLVVPRRKHLAVKLFQEIEILRQHQGELQHARADLTANAREASSLAIQRTRSCLNAFLNVLLRIAESYDTAE